MYESCLRSFQEKQIRSGSRNYRDRTSGAHLLSFLQVKHPPAFLWQPITEILERPEGLYETSIMLGILNKVSASVPEHASLTCASVVVLRSNAGLKVEWLLRIRSVSANGYDCIFCAGYEARCAAARPNITVNFPLPAAGSYFRG